MKQPNGHYRTRAGSTVEVYGDHSGCVRVTFDWYEEPNACCECVVQPYPVDWGDGEFRLAWRCDYCDGGSAELFPDRDCMDEESAA